MAARRCREGGGAHGPHVARGSGEAGSCRGASAPGGRENLAVHVASHPRRERRVTSPLAGEERSEGAGGSDVGPQRRGHGGSGGGICCLSSGCRPSELGPGARAQRAALRRWLRGRREPGEGSRGCWGGGEEAPEGRGLCEGGPPNPFPPFPPSPSPQPTSSRWSPGWGLCPVTMTTPANAQNASKTWELSLYELHRTPQVTGFFLHNLFPLPKSLNPKTPSHSLFAIFCPARFHRLSWPCF